MAAEPRELMFPELLGILWRRRWLLVVGAVAGGLAGLAIPRMVPPSYVAETLVMIEPRPAPTADGMAPPGPVAVDGGVVDSQVQVLGSRQLAREVIAGLDLGRDSELNGVTVSPISVWLGNKTEPPSAAPSGDMVGRFLDRLEVRRSGKSQVIAVAWTSADAAKAARVANKLAELYLVGQLAQKLDSVKRSSGWLAEQLAQVKGRLYGAELALTGFRNGTPGARGQSLGIDAARSVELQRQLAQAGADRAGREAQLERLRVALAAGQPVPLVDGGSLLLHGLNQQKGELARRLAELRIQLGARHPTMQSLLVEKADVEARLAAEQAALVRTLEADASQARAREAWLTRDLGQLEAEALRLDDTVRREATLQHDLEVHRRLYDTLREKAGAVDRESVHEPDARIISEAVAPDLPVQPKPRLIMALAVTVGLSLALVAVYLIETRDGGFRSARDVQRILGLAPAALVPDTGGRRLTPPHDYVLEHPRSRYAEALRGLLGTCLAGGAPGAGRVVMLTSALPGEGKSTLALSLARLAAGDGLRVLLVDADLRRPTLHERAGLAAGPGLVEALRREVPIAEAVRRDPRSAVLVLPGSARLEQPTRLLAGESLRLLLEGARTRFDLVLVDTAPLLAVADARLVAPRADLSLVLAAFAQTPRASVEEAIRALRAIGVAQIALVLSRVDARARAGLGEAGVALRRLEGYYAD